MNPAPTVRDSITELHSNEMHVGQFEVALARVFEALSPAELVNSEMLLSSFHRLLSRCSTEERQLLLPPQRRCKPKLVQWTDSSSSYTQNSIHTHRKGEHPKSRQANTVPPSLAVDAGLPVLEALQNHQDPEYAMDMVSSPSESSYDLCSNVADSALEIAPVCAPSRNDNDAEAYAVFNAKLGTRGSRAKYLLRALRGFVGAMDNDAQIYTDLWSAKTKIFVGSGTDPIARLRRLYEGFIRIKCGREKYDCASRLCYLFLDHDLELLLTYASLPTSRGRGRKTAAFYAQAESISSTVEAVKADSKSGRCYLQLLKCSSPGFLLLIGSQVNTLWERKLSKADIPILLDYINEFHPEIVEKALSLNAIAAQLIIDGFIAYGWTESELINTQTQLLCQLRHYVNFSSIQSSSTLDNYDASADIELDSTRASSVSDGEEVITLCSTLGCGVDTMFEAESTEALDLPGELLGNLSSDTQEYAECGSIATPNLHDFQSMANTDLEMFYDGEQGRGYISKANETLLQDISLQESWAPLMTIDVSPMLFIAQDGNERQNQ